MRKIFILIAIAIMSVSGAYADAAYALKHANPMPNLVRYAMGNAELLQLTQAQVKEIKAWSDANKANMMQLAQKVVSEEKMLLEESLTTDKDVLKKAEVSLETRREIIRIKTLCRTHLKNVLSKKQYAQVVSIYRSTLPKK